MNRNVESHFAELPSAEIQRSIFDRSFSHKTTFNTGELIPVYLEEVLPGDTFNVQTSCVVRLQTPLTPVMDNIWMDTYFFFVPMRIVWEHAKEFFGENSQSAWLPSTTYTIPQIEPPSGGYNVGTIADYMGIPVGYKGTYVSEFNALPFRCYAAIANEWFRDQNVTDPVYFPVGDTGVTGSNGGTYQTDVYKGGLPFKVAKVHDYFTSCLPSPQKSQNVNIFGNYSTGIIGQYDPKFAPVYPRQAESFPYVATGNDPNFYPLHLRLGQSSINYNLASTTQSLKDWFIREANTNPDVSSYAPTNLWADLGAVNISINELRLAFQLQKFFEKQARGGTRYREVILTHFGVHSPDARMMIPEYLGGHRFPLVIHQIANQAASSGEYLGDVGAMSNTADVHDDFIKSFTEHGYVLGVACVRYEHSYPQGFDKMWLRKQFLDFYWPTFANIGEQPVHKWELYVNDTITGPATDVFGYNEAWAEYRYAKNRVSAEMRPGVSNSLATWHFADYYNQYPSLSDSWIREDKSNVDRVLSVTSSTANQIFADFYFKNICTRPMPMYSVPGLIDHH